MLIVIITACVQETCQTEAKFSDNQMEQLSILFDLKIKIVMDKFDNRFRSGHKQLRKLVSKDIKETVSILQGMISMLNDY